MMKLIRGLINIRPEHRGCVVTIGNFDGMHLGHQKLIKHLRKEASARSVPLLVIVFEPQPNEFFRQDKIPNRLMRLREKLAILRELQVDRVLCLHFNKQLADLPAEEFINEILVSKLGIKHIEVGDDFRFGHKRQGDINLLVQYGRKYHFTASQMPTLMIAGERVSSTRIRQALEQADLNTAELLLGRPFGMSGHVAHGDKRGRLLGFPTANIYLHRRNVPVAGIFAVKVYRQNSQVLYGVANVGTRPTFNGTRSLLEVYLFNFNEEIYSEPIYVEFIHKFRDEEKYDSIEALKKQMERDVIDARVYFGLGSQS